MFKFPNTRLRRKRSNVWVRNLTSESILSVNDLIFPLFVHDREETTESIPGLPDIKCYSIDGLVSVAQEAKDLGINAVAIFPVVDSKLKSENAEEAYNPGGLICKAIRAVKLKVLDIGIIADVALDPYTTHGHDGILKSNLIDVENDETVSVLCKQALALAKAGCNIVAPSDMMDGRIGKIRKALDDNDFQDVAILSYAVKYCSSFYAPFRQVVGSCVPSNPIDKSGYQMDYRNAREAICEIEMDINEGADFIMIKPGMPYLDVIKSANDKFNFPIFAYQVSGEYAMIKAATNNGWLDYDKVIYESLIGFKRAGASAIFTYAALDVAKNLS
ncbi:porphobilinogen synthase [Wolbachia endosymbiont of Atemnus politus]|uniref:porphobilinogen synthase n=1 Tax=Wolbachia endosymbiont of Atemnus politus TaxID=2682840 RepID=UPI0015742D4B|nr:porphobilinogen synthase [Wolbachia endosymbiont of Atemnus politus]NSM56247.1 porphobilinogen synthase [Wolbachia endosymbiont of Atemnus politus]NSX83020.1 porphobilinogen synthase [Wolbachia endosymbiont of Atemnus politus]